MMKKYIYNFLILAVLAFSFGACEDVNKGKDLSRPPYVIHETVTMDKDKFTTLISKLDKNNEEHKEAIAFMKANNAFSSVAEASIYAPYLIKDLYHAADEGSSVTLKYNYVDGVSKDVAALMGATHKLGDEDYKLVWGDIFASAFTPAKSPSKNMDKILKAKFPTAQAGDAQNVAYQISPKEPIDVTVIGEKFFAEDFETIETGSGKVIDLDGWLNFDLTGSFAWQGRSFNNNKYGNVSSYNSKAANDIWLITPKIKLEDVSNILLEFNINTRNFTADCLGVLISTNFDGTQANALTANWTDVSSSFDLSPVPGNDNIHSAGQMTMDAYKGKEVYIAFRYDGDDTSAPKRTTTYQIDAVTVYVGVPGIAVESSELEYGLYKYDGNAWVEYGKDAMLLQPADYTAMGSNYPDMKVEVAHEQLPKYLKQLDPMAMNGKTVTVVYYTSSSNVTAEEYTLENGEWIRNTWITEREGQFIRTVDGWLFDPTILINFEGNASAYSVVYNYVKNNQALTNPALLHDTRLAEFYYGFSATHNNVSYRATDRANDPSFPGDETIAVQSEFMDKRTEEGLSVYLSEIAPSATPVVSGIKQFAEISGLPIYSDPSHPTTTNRPYTYILQCVGDKKWKAISRTYQKDGSIEELGEEE